MLRDEVAKYSELSGNDGEHTPIGIIGAYLDGYDKGRRTLIDDVKAEIETERHNLADTKEWGRYYGLGIALEILDNIGKAESED